MPTTNPIAHAMYPAQLTPTLGPDHRLPVSMYSAAIAPQMGPKDAPTIPKKPTRLPARPVIAKMALTVIAATVEAVRGILGNIVLKLLAAINDEKQVGTREAAAKRKNMRGANAPTLAIAAV